MLAKFCVKVGMIWPKFGYNNLLKNLEPWLCDTNKKINNLITDIFNENESRYIYNDSFKTKK